MIIDTTSNWKLMQGFQVTKVMKLKVNTAVDYNSLLNRDYNNQYTYYEVNSVVDRLQKEGSDKVVAKLILELDYRSTYIERKVYTFYGMISEIGGFIGIFLPLFALISQLFSNRIYRMTLLSYFYKVSNKNVHKDDHSSEDLNDSTHLKNNDKSLNLNK